jgi:hypothetical protein
VFLILPSWWPNEPVFANQTGRYLSNAKQCGDARRAIQQIAPRYSAI